MVEPGCGTRCAIRDTGAPGEGRYHWTVTVFEETEPVAARRTRELGEARSLGTLAYVEGGEPSSRGRDNGSLARLFWRVFDDLDYWLTQARLWLWTRCAAQSRRRRLMSPIASSFRRRSRKSYRFPAPMRWLAVEDVR